jgi:hypothetical protein
MEIGDLTQYGSLGVGAFAVIQLSKFVGAISLFLNKLESSWKEQEEHRKQEKAYWATMEKYHEEAAEQWSRRELSARGSMNSVA